MHYIIVIEGFIQTVGGYEMKSVGLASCLLLLLFAGAVHAEDPDRCFFSPYSMDATYREAAAPYIQYVEDNWHFYQNGLKRLKKIENTARMTYRSRRVNCTFQLDLTDLKPGLRTKIQLFDKPVFFVFSVRE